MSEFTQESEVDRISRLYAALSRINQAVVRLPSGRELFARVCQILVEDGGFSMAWIGWQDPVTRMLEPAAQWGDAAGFVKSVAIRSNNQTERRGPTGTAFRTGEIYICNDMHHDPRLASWQESARRRGFRGVAILPIREGGVVRGTLSVYALEVDFFQDREVALLKEAAVDISFGLDNLARQDARLRAEEALRESEQRFRATFEQAAVGIAHVAMDGTFLRINDKLCQITGYPREELMQQHYGDLAVADEPGVAQTIREEMCANLQSSVPLEHRFRHKDGTVYTASIAADAVRGPDGVPKYVVAVVSDISERKSLELQFLRAQRMESIGTLAGGIAHDLNNVFAPIIMSLELLKADHPDSESQELIEVVSTSAKRGAALVRQVLLFARGVEGRRVPVPVHDLLHEVAIILRETFLRHIELRLVIADGLWSVLGDRTQLHQVLMNLCLNARDAMPDGGVLSIAATNQQLDAQHGFPEPEAHPGPWVVLTVTDTGAGMAVDLIEKIFDPFFTTKDVGQGTGLGLSTALGIVKSHGGFMRAESSLGHSSTFTVYFPAQTAHAVAPLTAASTQFLRGNGELILVVDDETAIREITRQTLEAFGYRVVAAANGAEALKIHATLGDEIDAVLTDMMMPVMDGAATIQALHAVRPRLSIVATSGVAPANLADHATDLGVTHFLAKPYSTDELLRVMRTTLADRFTPRHH